MVRKTLHRNASEDSMMSLNFHPFSDFLVVVGRKASGKTVFTKFAVKGIRRKIIIDPTWQMGSLGYVVHFPERIKEAMQKFGAVVYQPKHMDELTYDQAFEECLQWSNYTLVIDEIDKFARPRWYISQALNELINRGRHQGIGLICNSRRPHKTHNDIRSNADFIVCFHLHEERDLQYMARWIGTSEDNIKNLKAYHSILYIVQGSQIIKQAPCSNIL